MRISLITDELSADPETAIELATEWGIHDFELRGYFLDRAPILSPYEKHHLRDVLAEYGARIVAVSPGLFKIPCPPEHVPRASLTWMERAGFESRERAKQSLEYHLNELLPATLDYANELGAKIIVTFCFDRGGAPPGDPPRQVIECMLKAAEQARAAGLVLAVENEDGFWADTGSRTANLLKQINHPAIRVNWDPGNAFFAGDEPFPAGYDKVRDDVAHVHFKNARHDSHGKLEYGVEGEIDWAGQICALAADGYEGLVSIETHSLPKVASARKAFELLQSYISNANKC
jgi:sugar phosphate isomerase/epimerase